MFSGCTSLIGGNGFTYKAGNSNDITNANAGDNGYLTTLDQCKPYAVLEGEGKTLVFRYGYKTKSGVEIDENFGANKLEITGTKINFAPATSDLNSSKELFSVSSFQTIPLMVISSVTVTASLTISYSSFYVS